jgi:prepilin-type N-terminal cleavage/methylation domain-containing protein
MRSNPRQPTPGFSLVELLTVLAVIGVLAAILIPSTLAMRISAKRARTKVQFSEWAAAMELFRQEYGYFPPVDGGSGGRMVPEYFAGTLTGRSVDGLSPATPDHLAGNVRTLRFYNLAESELGDNRTTITDAFGNTDIAVLYDRNADGVITAADGEIVAVAPREGGAALQPSPVELDLTTGIRAGVIFYSAGRGLAAGDLVLSWK